MRPLKGTKLTFEFFRDQGGKMELKLFKFVDNTVGLKVIATEKEFKKKRTNLEMKAIEILEKAGVPIEGGDYFECYDQTPLEGDKWMFHLVLSDGITDKVIKENIDLDNVWISYP